ncbi:MAG: SDR family oxidoreductase [Bacteroidota bacterium]|nr:MAG: SDR family oxidoreductase [Bacteroidota bacterium]
MLANKVVLVTGGSRGLGKAIIENLLKNDCQVATFSRNKPEIAGIDDIRNDRPRLLFRSVDIRDTQAVQAFISEVNKTYGKIDALINNAAVNHIGLFSLMPEKRIDELFEINVLATIKITRMVVQLMMKKNNGVIVNISSIMAQGGYKGSVVYGASKAAIDGLTRGLARELGEKNIRVNSIVPGYIETDMTKEVTLANREKILHRTPLKRLGNTNDLMGLIDFLLGDSSRHITGQSFVVDGGLTC